MGTDREIVIFPMPNQEAGRTLPSPGPAKRNGTPPRALSAEVQAEISLWDEFAARQPEFPIPG